MAEEPEISKSQALRMLRKAINLLDGATECCSEAIKDRTDLPEAFTIIAKHLPTVQDIFTSIKSYLNSDLDETQEVKDVYPELRRVTDGYNNCLQFLEDLFESVKQAQGDEQTKQYRSAVRACKGKRVEEVMQEVLENAIAVAQPPLVTNEQVKELQDALKEVKRLPPTLDEEPRGTLTMINNGPGSQFYHGGRGNLNSCTGGFQVTGDNHNATYSYTGSDTITN